MERISLETQTLYNELMEQLSAQEAHRSIGHLPGTFVTKKVKGGIYYYFQYSTPGGVLKQIYLGKEDAVLQRVLEKFEKERPLFLAEQKNIQRLCAQLRVGGALVTDASSGRVLKALADAGVFQGGGVLVGTHAFSVLGNLLGYRWEGAGLKTQDVDLASPAVLDVAVPENSADIPKALESLEMGFLPVTGFHPSDPSTSFKVRGQALRVDLLTPEQSPHRKKSVLIPRWNAWAQPLRYLDYLLEDTVRGAVIDGGGILVYVPTPARFALHKLIVSQERSVAFHGKGEKDLRQAAQILEVLAAERPGDLTMAWKNLKGRGVDWVKKAKAGLSALRRWSQRDYVSLFE
ncbi:hypothetical protein FBR05_06525 [Deltaproteobacteria bacterium PRO3]|nr:hypothetical protein [Deltaproteobacteria bacterium PRO3]